MSTRRDFLKTSAAAGVAAGLSTAGAFAAGDETIKVGLIGCGGRGTARSATSWRRNRAYKRLGGQGRDHSRGRRLQDAGRWGSAGIQVGQPEEQLPEVQGPDQGHAGDDVRRPRRLPEGTDCRRGPRHPGDAAGFRPCTSRPRSRPTSTSLPRSRWRWTPPTQSLGLVDESKKQNIAIVAGTQRRHQAGYIETVEADPGRRDRRHRLGPVLVERRRASGSKPRDKGAVRRRVPDPQLVPLPLAVRRPHRRAARPQPGRDQLDHERPPGQGSAMGGRSVPHGRRTRRKSGNIWDHFAVEFEYPNGVPMTSYCPHIAGDQDDVSETVFGTKGVARVNRYVINEEGVHGRGPDLPVRAGAHRPDQQHPGRQAAQRAAVRDRSTMTAILGREAAYTGQTLTWDQVLNAKRGDHAGGPDDGHRR